MVEYVWDRVISCDKVDLAIVATDDARIFEVCDDRKIEVQMTSSEHATGTDRVAEVARSSDANIIVNVQGDEPLIASENVDLVIECLNRARSRGIEVATGFLAGANEADKASPSTVNLTPTLDGCVLGLSRHPIPFEFRAPFSHNTHVGLYAFSRDALERFSSRRPGPAEKSESIELLRFLEYGERIAAVKLPHKSVGVDYPEDIEKVESIMRSKKDAIEPS